MHADRVVFHINLLRSRDASTINNIVVAMISCVQSALGELCAVDQNSKGEPLVSITLKPQQFAVALTSALVPGGCNGGGSSGEHPDAGS